MAALRKYCLRTFVSLKYITVNVIDHKNGRIVVSASTIESSIKRSMDCGRTSNTKAAEIIGEILAMRLRVAGLDQGRGIHVNINKEIAKKGLIIRSKILAIVNSLKTHRVKIVEESTPDDTI